MIALLQRVLSASVQINGQTQANINNGLLVLAGFEKGDRELQLPRFFERICGYRIFEDESGKMNLSLRQIEGQLLLVPQFTLAADTNQGMRPGFSSAATPAVGKQLFDQLSVLATESDIESRFGVFGADMQVSLINDGPVTFWLQV